MHTKPFALQLYSVRDHLDRDPAWTLRRVKAAGYDYVELAGTAGLEPEPFRELLDNAGLEAVSGHFPYEMGLHRFDAVVSGLQAFGLSLAVIPWLEPSHDLAVWRERARALEDIGARLRQAGIRLSYHNHEHEFTFAGGQLIFNLLFEETHPDHLAVQLDTGWAHFAGADSAALIRAYAGRIPSIHLKQYTRRADGSAEICELAKGDVDWEPVVAAARASGVDWFVVEQDESAGDSLESARHNAATAAELLTQS
jgi:sugar phosphate isomerase/epimerase